jgi:uracil-DNA glycosylase
MTTITVIPRYKEEWSVYDLAMKLTPIGWEDVFEESKDNLASISSKLDKEGKYYPIKRNIFRCLELIRPENVKVVIIGMDPYPGEYGGVPYATGLSFSVGSSVPMSQIPASLRNIFKELKDDLPTTVLTSGDLTPWVRQGVLLINASLTGQAGAKSGSHGKMWYGLIQKVLEKVKKNGNVVYVLWGKDAQEFSGMIGNKGVRLECPHPSPFSANKGFFGCKHFSTINKCLSYWKLQPVDFST